MIGTPCLSLPLPTATYRLQFRNGMTFEGAVALIPHLVDLGISHLYASPVFTAVTGSTHGYDISNANEIDPALGGHEGFVALANALHHAGLGLILDIVPNHMAASLENPWWHSVLQWGADSPYARHFDIDWRMKLTLPFLGSSFEKEAADGKIKLALDPERRLLALAYYDQFYPLTPSTYPAALESLRGNAVARNLLLGASIQQVDDANEQDLAHHLGALSQDVSFLTAIHDLQPWQLRDYHTASQQLSYRRFFEITGLVGMRVEDERVFDDTHRLVLELVEAGLVDGLRIDHVDGLADPKAYLEMLRRETGDDILIVVEKILAGGEDLPQDWPVSGTTGYEFITAIAGIMADPNENGQLDDAFHSLTDPKRPFEVELRACKDLMLTVNFAGEVERLAGLAAEIARAAGAPDDIPTLAAAIRALIVEMPTYRTYATIEGIGDGDGHLLAEVAERALRSSKDDVTRSAIVFLQDRLVHTDPALDADMLAELRARFQQLSAPVMAKALEDTLFYRNSAFLARNEVGDSPAHAAGGIAHLHAAMESRAALMPHALSATSTHDTKRGEDARARLYTLSEAPREWAADVERWRQMNAHLVAGLDDGAAPEPQLEWTIYQSLLGVWPAGDQPSSDALSSLNDRLKDFAVKAVREAKQRTSWSDNNEPYEQAVTSYAQALLDPGNGAFQADFHQTIQPHILAGLVNSLSQTLLKLTAPGIPDIYQGCEGLDLSLVDPDNRRPFDVIDLDDDPLPLPDIGNIARYKQKIIRAGLSLRRQKGADLCDAEYRPLELSGPASDHWLAFMRRGKSTISMTLVPRLALGRLEGGDLTLSPEMMQDTALLMPPEYDGIAMRNLISGALITGGAELDLSTLLAGHPVALLVADALV